VHGKGYEYLDGVGGVTMKDGRVVKLGPRPDAQPTPPVTWPRPEASLPKADVAGEWSGEADDGVSIQVTVTSSGGKTSVTGVGYSFPPTESRIERLVMDDGSAFADTPRNDLSFSMPVLSGFSGLAAWYKVDLSWADAQTITATLTKTGQPPTEYAKKITAQGTSLIMQKGEARESYRITLKRK
jgi:hypothetical protein